MLSIIQHLAPAKCQIYINSFVSRTEPIIMGLPLNQQCFRVLDIQQKCLQMSPVVGKSAQSKMATAKTGSS